MSDHYHHEDTQPIPVPTMRDRIRLITDPAPAVEVRDGVFMDERRACPEAHAAAGHRAIAVTDEQLSHRLDAIGHTVCDLTVPELRTLAMVVARERFSLLSERRVYVLARKQDTQRFNELLKLLDTRIASITALTDKLAQLITVRS